MFTGIVETMGEIVAVNQKKANLQLTLHSNFTAELQVDQSIAHNGVCLTVVEISGEEYTVDVIAETINKTNIANWNVGTKINLERSLTLQNPLDGHIVQGHVDTVLQCVNKQDEQGSYRYTFSFADEWATYLIPKGSICINGVSLTIAHLADQEFSVAIIPYTYEHTSFHQLQIGDYVNVEFDVVGKYINRIAQFR